MTFEQELRGGRAGGGPRLWPVFPAPSPGPVPLSSEDPHPPSACCVPRNPRLCHPRSLPSLHPAFTLSPLRTQITPDGEQRLQQGQDTGFPDYLHTLGAPRSVRRLLCPVLLFRQVQLGYQQQRPVELPPSSRCGTPVGWVGPGVGRDGAPEIHPGAQGGWLQLRAELCAPNLLSAPQLPLPRETCNVPPVCPPLDPAHKTLIL